MSKNAPETSYNSEYPAPLRSAQIAPFGRNFGYSREGMDQGDVLQKAKDIDNR